MSLTSPIMTMAEDVSVPVISRAAPRNTNLDAFGSVFDRGEDQSRRLAAYRADATGMWFQPQPKQSELGTYYPLHLTTPGQVIAIDLAVVLAGGSPEEETAQLLDEVIQRAQAEPRSTQDTSPDQSASQNQTLITGIAKLADGIVASSTEEPAGETSEQTAASDDEEAMVSVARYARDDVLVKLERLVRNTGPELADREELHWMLDQWRPGPIWLLARDALAPPERGIEPLFSWIDDDRDGLISQSEIEQVTDRLVRVDENRDTVILKSELMAVMNRDHRRLEKSAPRFDWRLAWKDASGSDSGNQPAEPAPSTTLKVILDLRTSQAALSIADMADRLMSTSFASRLGPQLTVGSDQVSLQTDPRGGVSASCGAENHPVRVRISGFSVTGLSRVNACQFSIAAKMANDVFWATLDADGDGRIEEIERRSSADRLMTLDLNGDQTISPDEWPVTIDIVISQGNGAVDRLNEENVVPEVSAPKTVAPPPDWFVGMDTNNDQALSSQEFLGSSEQFEQYDIDQDGLITPAEVNNEVQP